MLQLTHSLQVKFYSHSNKENMIDHLLANAQSRRMKRGRMRRDPIYGVPRGVGLVPNDSSAGPATSDTFDTSEATDHRSSSIHTRPISVFAIVAINCSSCGPSNPPGGIRTSRLTPRFANRSAVSILIGTLGATLISNSPSVSGRT